MLVLIIISAVISYKIIAILCFNKCTTGRWCQFRERQNLE